MADRKLVEECCEVLHNAYEKAAVETGWETQKASRKQWADIPKANQSTMRIAVNELLNYLEGTHD